MKTWFYNKTDKVDKPPVRPKERKNEQTANSRNITRRRNRNRGVSIRTEETGNSLAVQLLGLCASIARGKGSIPG